MEYSYEYILVRFGELSTKGKNKKDFIKRLTENVKNALHNFSKLEYKRTHDRLYIVLNGEDHEEVCNKLKTVFGIYSFFFYILQWLLCKRILLFFLHK